MGRILSIDFGLRRVGAALSDPRRQIATPLEVYERRTESLDARHYRELFEEEGVERVVIGLPLHTGGGESDLSRAARAWGAWLASATGRPVVFFDERYTTVSAEQLMRDAGLKALDRKARRDMVAAQLLLQAYLDAGCPEAEAPPAPLEDAGEPDA
jgi:putative Holliday junction resolvase